MSFSLISLLVHDPAVPATARAMLLAAEGAPAGDREVYLRVAARVLAVATHLDCADALELVGLDEAADCGARIHRLEARRAPPRLRAVPMAITALARRGG